MLMEEERTGTVFQGPNYLPFLLSNLILTVLVCFGPKFIHIPTSHMKTLKLRCLSNT